MFPVSSSKVWVENYCLRTECLHRNLECYKLHSRVLISRNLTKTIIFIAASYNRDDYTSDAITVQPLHLPCFKLYVFWEITHRKYIKPVFSEKHPPTQVRIAPDALCVTEMLLLMRCNDMVEDTQGQKEHLTTGGNTFHLHFKRKTIQYYMFYLSGFSKKRIISSRKVRSQIINNIYIFLLVSLSVLKIFKLLFYSWPFMGVMLTRRKKPPQNTKWKQFKSV